jgi:hypothetical protein
MKNLFLSAIFSVITFSINAQVVTVSGFGTHERFGPVNSTRSIEYYLLEDDSFVMPTNELPTSYKYVIDFKQKTCTLFVGIEEVNTFKFIVLEKKSDQDFQIQFVLPTDEFNNTYGIIVKNIEAAFVQYNGLSVNLTIFESMYIF